MNFGGNAAFDLALERAEQERDAGIADARAALASPGREDCEDCGRAIPIARRHAYPSAVRCVECQQHAETNGAAQ